MRAFIHPLESVTNKKTRPFLEIGHGYMASKESGGEASHKASSFLETWGQPPQVPIRSTGGGNPTESPCTHELTGRYTDRRKLKLTDQPSKGSPRNRRIQNEAPTHGKKERVDPRKCGAQGRRKRRERGILLTRGSARGRGEAAPRRRSPSLSLSLYLSLSLGKGGGRREGKKGSGFFSCPFWCCARLIRSERSTGRGRLGGAHQQSGVVGLTLEREKLENFSLLRGREG